MGHLTKWYGSPDVLKYGAVDHQHVEQLNKLLNDHVTAFTMEYAKHLPMGTLTFTFARNQFERLTAQSLIEEASQNPTHLKVNNIESTFKVPNTDHIIHVKTEMTDHPIPKGEWDCPDNSLN